MNLVEFIQKHQDARTINYIKPGFQKSQFVSNISEIPTLMKNILNKLLAESDRQKIYNQLQSGGLPTTLTAQSKTETYKKQSFCTEFNMMITNIIGLLGFELSKYLMLLFGVKHFVKLILDEISTCTSYEDVGTYINYIRNIFLLGATNDSQSNPVSIDESFDFEKYSCMMNDNFMSRGTINYFNTNFNTTREEQIFDWMLKYIESHIKNENIISFTDDKRMFSDIISDMLDHLKLGTYEVSDITEIIINLGRFNVCYDKSFIKMIELLYQEGFADIPQELRKNYKPYVIYIENDLKLDVKCEKYTMTLNKYFHDVYENTLKCVIDSIPNDYLNINIHESVYDTLADITLNLFVNMCRKIYNNQLIYGYFGKSTRIQFIQVFQAFMDSVPRYYTLTKHQRNVVHYILLSDKILNESIDSVNKLNGVSDDDDDDEEQEDKSVSAKRETSSSSSSDDDTPPPPVKKPSSKPAQKKRIKKPEDPSSSSDDDVPVKKPSSKKSKKQSSSSSSDDDDTPPPPKKQSTARKSKK